MKIVITGGPSAGKTSVVDILHRSCWDQLRAVPEAAAMLFSGGFPRGKEHIGLRCQQRAIYYVQKELEELGTYDSCFRHLICDRGSLDGLAYWPDDEASFFESVGSSMSKELERYEWVLHLDTASEKGYQQSDIRIEPMSEALVLNEKIKYAWRMHPQRIIIPNKKDFLVKVQTATLAVQRMLAGSSVEAIRREFELSV